MDILSIDIETFGSNDIKSCGLHKYVEAPDFEITLLTYSLNFETEVTIDLYHGENIPLPIWLKLFDPEVMKTSHNAAFEIAGLQKHFNITLFPEQWSCSMVRVAMLGYPLSLDAAAKAMRLPVEKNKDGKSLIPFFCSPVKPTKVNGQKRRNWPTEYREKWNKFKRYNGDDVKTEVEELKAVIKHPIPGRESRLWLLDQEINNRGVNIDMDLVNAVIEMNERFTLSATAEAKRITGLANPNSATQLKAWLAVNLPYEITDSLKAEDVEALLEVVDDVDVRRVLELRQQMSKTSIKKYSAIQKATCYDGRLKGLFQLYGANRTGRFAGRLVQPQNLASNHMDTDMDPDALDRARRIVLRGDMELLEILYGSVPDVLSQLIRTAFIPSTGNKLIVSDLAAIEARIIAWLSGEKWRLEVFKGHGKIYEASIAKMLGISIDKVTKELRKRGKVSELALGYQGGPNALIKMGAIKMGIEEDELPRLVKMWRNANPKIVSLWYAVNEAALSAVRNPGRRFKIDKGVSFIVKDGFLLIGLPSGRNLSYVRPRIVTNRFDQDSIAYDGMNQTTKVWGQQETYGGKLVENIVQAIARDVLVEQMFKIDSTGFDIVLHVHDEVVVDFAEGYYTSQLSDLNAESALTLINDLMASPVPWAPDLPLAAAGFVTPYYKKD